MALQWFDIQTPQDCMYGCICICPQPGQTYVMYHGTTRCNAQSIMACGFRPSADGMLGPGVYLSRNLHKASRYPKKHPEYDKVVLKVLVNVGRVKRITKKSDPLRKTWHYRGYDTAYVPAECGMVKSGQEEHCVWDPCRIQILCAIYPTSPYCYNQ